MILPLFSTGLISIILSSIILLLIRFTHLMVSYDQQTLEVCKHLMCCGWAAFRQKAGTGLKVTVGYLLAENTDAGEYAKAQIDRQIFKANQRSDISHGMTLIEQAYERGLLHGNKGKLGQGRY